MTRLAHSSFGAFLGLSIHAVVGIPIYWFTPVYLLALGFAGAWLADIGSRKA